MRQVANTVPIECRIEGVHRCLEADENDDDTEDHSISAYWYNPANDLISRNTEKIFTYYEQEGIFLEVLSEAVTQCLYRCVSQVEANGAPEGVIFIGLYRACSIYKT